MNTRITILIVDDTPENLRVLGDLLKNEDYDVRIATNGKGALENIKKSPPDLILLDIMMPDMNGYQVCRELKSNPLHSTIPIIFISALGMSEDKINAFREGAVDYITKPFNAEEVLARVKTNVENKLYRDHLEDLVESRTHQLEIIKEATIASMAILAEFRDTETGAHIQRTKYFVKILAQELSREGKVTLAKNEIELLFHSAPLHDIGKVGIPDSILHKTEKLNADEFEVMKQHSLYGFSVIKKTAQILGENSFLIVAQEMTAAHHEKWDGSGYPQGLKGDAIPFSARLMALADIYDALRTKRPYKEAMSHEDAVRIVTQGDGRTMPEHFDPAVLQAFLLINPEFERIYCQYSDCT